MELKIFTKNDCSFCDQLDIPKEIHTTVINVDEKKYRGFIPEQLPVLQYNGMNFQGPQAINEVLNLVRNAQDDYYKK
tara:strand:+ start:648 stop:878 length:231 start_codon:yes stop_codon:yes gene_type:complete